MWPVRCSAPVIIIIINMKLYRRYTNRYRKEIKNEKKIKKERKTNTVYYTN